MKRVFVITLAFCILSIPFLTGCTVNFGEDSCRGLGYECGVCYAEMCSCVAVEKEWSEMFDVYDAVVEGKDYSEPRLEWNEYEQDSSGELTVSMDIYNDFVLHKFEILFIQDGIILDSANITERWMSQGNFCTSFTIDLTNKKDTGGEVYYIINAFVANKRR